MKRIKQLTCCLVVSIATIALCSCNPYKKEMEDLRKGKEEAERKLKEEKEAINSIYKE